MAPSVRVRLGKKRDTGPCGNCEDEIASGIVHAAVMRSFGRSHAGVAKWRGDHVHLRCLPAFLMRDYTGYRDRERKPRGENRRHFDLTSEQMETRRHLIRTRARLLRLVLEAVPEERILFLRGQIINLQMELTKYGGPPRQSMVRRSPEARAILEPKLAMRLPNV